MQCTVAVIRVVSVSTLVITQFNCRNCTNDRNLLNTEIVISVPERPALEAALRETHSESAATDHTGRSPSYLRQWKTYRNVCHFVRRYAYNNPKKERIAQKGLI